VSDAVGLEEVVSQVIQDNQEVAEKVKAGKESAVQFLMGQVMRETSGKANPGMVIKLIRQKLLEE